MISLGWRIGRIATVIVPLLIVLSWLAAVPAPQAPPAAADLARNLQRKYEQVRDFSADFEHIYEGGVMRKKLTERGTLLVKKPGMMRWAYTSPEKKVFVSDGRTLYSYVPADRQVIVSTVPPSDEASSPAMFLAGKGSIQRDFTPRIAAAEGLASSEVALELVPRTRQNEYDWIVLVVDRTSLQIRRLVTADSQGGTSTFVFTKLRENVGLPDTAFAFTIPRGVDIVTDGSRHR
jgi:outer membrane lipoprotein carrier protein